MCSNPYIDETLFRQRIAEARAAAAQYHLVSSVASRRAPGVWARARRLLHGVYWAPQRWRDTFSRRRRRHGLVVRTDV